MGIESTDQIFRSERDVGGLDGGAAAAAALCPESGEMKNLLTSDFGKVQKASKMASSERVLSMKSFRPLSGTTLIFNSSTSDLISVAEVVLRVTKFNVLSAFQPITPSI